MRYFIILFLIFLCFSCDNNSKKKQGKLDVLYNKKLQEVQKEPQFIIDKLELHYFKKSTDINKIKSLIMQIPKKYKYVITTFNILFSIEEPKGMKLDKHFLYFLLKYQESLNIQKFIAKNYYKAIDKSSVKAFYTLYALNYPFTHEDYENYSKINALTRFVNLNFLLIPIDYCEGNKCSDNFREKEGFINYLNNSLYKKGNENYKNLAEKYKLILEQIKSSKKKILEIYKRNQKLKRKKSLTEKHKIELVEKKEEIKYLNKEVIPLLNIYFYFYGNTKKLPSFVNKKEILENFFLNKTKLNEKILQFIYQSLAKESFPVKMLYYKYIKDSKFNLSKTQKIKLNRLIKEKNYSLLKYGFYKRFFPELFKKLNPRKYIKSNFLYIVVKDFSGYFLENLKKDTCSPNCDVDNISYFQYAPELIINQKDKLFDNFTKDKFGNDKLAGNEPSLYNYLKILIKSNTKPNKEQMEKLKGIKLVYIQELLKFF